MNHNELIALLRSHEGREFHLLCVIGAMAVAQFDMKYSDLEDVLVRDMCSLWQIDYHSVIKHKEQNATVTISTLLQVANKVINESGKIAFLDICIVAAWADNRILYGEQVLLIAITEALGLQREVLTDRYKLSVGTDFPTLGDPSTLEYYYRSKKSNADGKRESNSERKASQTEVEKLLEIFGLSIDSSIDDIKRAYRKAVLLHHPDRFPDDDAHSRAQKHERFLVIQRAYERLMMHYA